MRKIICIITLILMSTMSFAQSIFDKLEDLNDVSAVIITKDAFEILKKFPNANSEDMEIFNTAKGINELKIFSTEIPKIASEMESMVNTAIKSANLTQLMRVKDKDSRVKIYVKATKNKDIVSEVLMFVKNMNKSKEDESNATVISLTGDIDVNKLSKIANKYSEKEK